MNSKDAMTCSEELILESEHHWVLRPKVWLLTFDCDLHKNLLHSGAELYMFSNYDMKSKCEN